MAVLDRIGPRTWAIVAGLAIAVLYVASMAASGPWDPWETHYGEVARQINLRRDPLDLWWQPGNGGPDGNDENTFWSKPALPFWLMAVSMRLFGVGLSADPAEMVRPLLPELAIRLPSLLTGLLATVFLAYVVWRLVAPRAGILVGIVLATMPQWAIVTRQALTDMFFVGPLVIAMGAWALACLQPDRPLRTRGRGFKQIPWDASYVGFLAFFAIVALAPLAVLHEHVIDPYTVARVSRFARRPGVPSVATLQLIFVQLFVYWALALVVFLASLRWRRRSQIWMAVLYLAAGLSLMGKGMIGPGLVGALVLAHMIVTKRLHLLRRCGLWWGVLLFVIVGFPWHHAMILYRGERFVNELIVMNNLARFASGEQKQAVGSFAYYLETMGIAALPWSAIVPIAWWNGMRAFRVAISSVPEAQRPAVELQRLALLWSLVSLWTLTYSVTKYYHYLLPVLPPLAVSVGVLLHDAFAKSSDHLRRSPLALGVGSIVGAAILVLVVRDAINEPAWLAHLTTYLYTGMWREGAPAVERLIWACLPFLIGLTSWAAWRFRAGVVAMLLSALLVTAFVIDDYVPAASENWSQRSAMRVYFEQRAPDDRLVSWWFYYRGETFLSKGNVWVMKEPNRESLSELFEEYEGKGANLWFITTVAHSKRLASNLPHKYRNGLETMYESFHYKLVRVHVP